MKQDIPNFDTDSKIHVDDGKCLYGSVPPTAKLGIVSPKQSK